MRQDLRYALRMMARTPGFSLVALAALALGIGATTAIFSLVNATLIRPLPYPEPGRLVMLWGNVQRTVVERRGASYPDYVDWRDRARSFEGMAAVSDSTFTLYGFDEPERLLAEVASAPTFHCSEFDPSWAGPSARTRTLSPTPHSSPSSAKACGGENSTATRA